MTRLLLASAVSVLLSGCGLSADHDVPAYTNCLSRHPDDAVICQAPRQAYEVEPFLAEAERAGARPSAGISDQEGSRRPDLALPPVPLHPGSPQGLAPPER